MNVKLPSLFAWFLYVYCSLKLPKQIRHNFILQSFSLFSTTEVLHYYRRLNLENKRIIPAPLMKKNKKQKKNPLSETATAEFNLGLL